MAYWRLSAFYFFYFATLGALIPYWGLYLKSKGFSASEIGELMTIMMVTKIFAPYFWAWLSDYFGYIIQFLRLGAFLTVVIFAGVFFSDSFWELCFVMALFSIFWNAVLPQFEVITLRYIHDNTVIYSKIRLWGSVGFIVAVFGLGILVHYTGIDYILPVLMVLYISIWFVSHLIKAPPLQQKQVLGSLTIKQILSKPVVVALLVVCFLMQMGHGAYYSFYSILLDELGFSKITIGFLWAVGVVAEIVLFLYMPRLIKHYSVLKLLLFSLFIAVIRWLIIAFAEDNLSLLFIAQLMHAATFAIFHVTAIHLTHQYFTGINQGRGQALYSSVSFGAGGALGSLLTGYYWDSLGAVFIFTGSALLSFLAILVVWLVMLQKNTVNQKLA